MKKELVIELLEEHRTIMRLIHLYKILEGRVPLLPADLSNTTTEFEETLNLTIFKTTSLRTLLINMCATIGDI